MIWHELEEEIIIPLPEAFDMSANIGYLIRRDNECMYEVKGEIVTKVISVGKMKFLVQISVNNHKQMVVRLLYSSSPAGRNQKEQIVQYIYEWFDLEKDLTSFYEMAKTDPLLKMPAEKLYGLRLIGIPELFEALCWGILGQQINLTFAYTLKKQFVETYGELIEYNHKKYWVFPSYKKIAQLRASELANIKMTLKKSEYIIGIAKLMASGELAKEKLIQMNFKDAEKSLVKIRGIGPWTANYVLMRCLRFPTAFPVDDVGLMNSIKALYQMERKPTKKEMLEWSKPWTGWESYATFYLWRAKY